MIFPLRVGLDLGTSSVQFNVRGRGIVVDEPSTVAFYRNEGKVIAIGSKAVEMLGKTPAHIQATSPIRNGIVVNLPMTEALLRYFLRRIGLLYRPDITISVPANATNVAQRAVREAAKAAGATRVWLIESPLAAAWGAGLDMSNSTGIMIVDIGSGTTDIAVISGGQSIVSKSLKVGGTQFNTAIQDLLHYNYELLISEKMAEEIKINLGCAINPDCVHSMEVLGSDVVSGLPRSQVITNSEVYTAIQEPLQAILDAIKRLLAKISPALAGDLVERGIVLAGGGALLAELSTYLQEQLCIPVCVAENARRCVVWGTLRAPQDSLKKD